MKERKRGTEKKQAGQTKKRKEVKVKLGLLTS
jgi:hypothetical protein